MRSPDNSPSHIPHSSLLIPNSSLSHYLLKLETNVMLGGGKWVAEFNESFRNFDTGHFKFDLYVRGGTRPKGLLLSRLFAYFSLPNYNVGFYAKHLPSDDFKLGELISEVSARAEKHNVKWSWLVLFRNGKFPEKLVRQATSFEDKGLGLALVNTDEQDVDISSNILGRKALGLARAFK